MIPPDVQHLLRLASATPPHHAASVLQAAASAATGVAALRRLRLLRDLGLLSESQYRRRCRAVGLGGGPDQPPGSR